MMTVHRSSSWQPPLYLLPWIVLGLGGGASLVSAQVNLSSALPGPIQLGQATPKPADCEVVAVVLEERVCSADLEPSASLVERAREANPDSDPDAWRRDRRARTLTRLVLRPLLDAYAREHGESPTDAEVEKLQKEMLSIRLPDGRSPPDDEQSRAFVNSLVLNWKVQRSLHRRYGGRVLLSSLGFHVAVDAQLAYLREAASQGAFEISDAELARDFWRAAAMEGQGDGDVEGDEATELLAVAPWEEAEAPQN